MNNDPSPAGIALAIAMPVFNEQRGISGTLLDLDQVFSDHHLHVGLFLQDDQSTDDTVNMVLSMSTRLTMQVDIKSNVQNLGHGPTTLSAYHRAVASGAPVIMQLDSDGQFFALELIQLYESIVNGADIAIGVRVDRVDPWFRKVITSLLKIYLALRYRGRFPDPNTPIRTFSALCLTRMLSQIPGQPMVPNIYLTIIAAKQELRTEYFDVSHRPRRDLEPTGTMWQSSSTIKSVSRLFKFAVRAFVQLWKFRPRNNLYG